MTNKILHCKHFGLFLTDKNSYRRPGTGAGASYCKLHGEMALHQQKYGISIEDQEKFGPKICKRLEQIKNEQEKIEEFLSGLFIFPISPKICSMPNCPQVQFATGLSSSS